MTGLGELDWSNAAATYTRTAPRDWYPSSAYYGDAVLQE